MKILNDLLHFGCTALVAALLFAACGGSETAPEDCREGQLGCAPRGVPRNGGDCDDPKYPVDCSDGYCWEAGAHCTPSVLSCGQEGSPDEVIFRCERPEQRWTCCFGEPVLCPPDKPIYCPNEGCGTNGGCTACPDGVGAERACDF